MGTITLILAILALIIAIVALVIAVKKSSIKEVVTKEKTVKVEYPPLEHPFVYDKEKTTYTLSGNLEVTGSLSCLKKGGK